jgi:hypothetical protein
LSLPVAACRCLSLPVAACRCPSLPCRCLSLHCRCLSLLVAARRYLSLPCCCLLLPVFMYVLLLCVAMVSQPLHCGFLADHGGNDITGYFLDTYTNLHAVRA